MIIVLLLTTLNCFAAVSDASLKKTAEAEISVEPVDVREQAATVSTADYISASNTEGPAYWELSFNSQTFQPAGTGRISTGEEFRLENFGESPMFGIRGQRWFISPSAFPSRPHFGIGGTIQLNRAKADLVTSSGFRYDNLSLSTWLASFGPQAEFWLFKRRLGLGLVAEAGSAISVQSHRLVEANETKSPLFYRVGPSLRFYPWNGFFVSASYEYRDIIGDTDNLKLQSNNYLVALGLGI